MSITEAMEAIVSNATVILQPVIPFNGVCSKKERSYLQSVYQSDPEMDAFVSLLETGTNQTVSAYRQVLQQFDARMEYDATYLGSKLSLLELNQSQLLSEMALSASDIVNVLSNFNATQFVRCVTMDASCNLTHSLYNQYTAIRAQHEASKQLIRQQYLIASQRVAQFTNAVDSLITSLFEFYARIESVEGVLSAIGISFRPFPDLSLPSLSLPSLSLDWSLPQPEAIARRLATHVSHLQSVLNDTTQTLRTYTQTAQQHIETMTGNIPELFDDYHPPSVNTSLLQSDFQERSANFLSAISLAASNLRNDMQNSSAAVAALFPALSDTAISLFSTWTPRRFVTVDDNLVAVLAAMKRAISLVVTMDGFVRFCAILRHAVVILARGATPQLTIDVAETSPKTVNWTKLQWMTKLLPLFTPLMGASLMIILALSAGMMTYGPLLETYLGGCVRSDEGTSLTANLQILAENLVAMQGETAAVIGQQRYLQKRQDLCQSGETATWTSFETTRESIRNLWDRWQSSNYTMFLTEKCVQKSKSLEQLIMEYHSLQERVETEDLELLNSTFRCEALSRCTIQCNPPSEAILRKSVH
ncbi:hypothetical protein WA588_005830 [Blastocystis sp. NMH]